MKCVNAVGSSVIVVNPLFWTRSVPRQRLCCVHYSSWQRASMLLFLLPGLRPVAVEEFLGVPGT